MVNVGIQKIVYIFKALFSIARIGRHYNPHHNDTQYNDAHHNDTKHNDIEPNDTKQNYTHHNDPLSERFTLSRIVV